MKSAPPVVAIAGMHRSGTSLVAGLVRAAGLAIGDELLPASPTNPRGHFEDGAFVRLHDRALAANGTGWTLDGAPASLRWPDGLRGEMDAVLAARAHLPAWGWKDPRTTLFLDAWRDAIPSLAVVVVFRGAAATVASLRRRRDPPLVHRFHGAWPLRRFGLPMTRDMQAIRMWRAYNEAAMSFASRNEGRCAFVDAGRVRESWPALRAWLAERGVPLAEIDVGSHVDPRLFRADAPLDLRLRARVLGAGAIEHALARRRIA